MPDFKVADAEFDRQTRILEKLIETVDISSRQDGVTKYVIDGSELPALPAGGQNTMAAAAVVLLAAHFEEYVRQQVEEYAKAVILDYQHLSDDFRERLIDTYWRMCSGKLNRIRPKGDPLWASSAEPLLRGLIGFPIGGNISEFIASIVCEHEHNMRWETVRDITKRVGISDLSALMFKSASLRNKIGSHRKSDFSGEMLRKLNDFYKTRNGIVHSISQNAGIGPSLFHDWAEFFRIFTTAFADALMKSFQEFDANTAPRRAANNVA